MTRVWLLCPWSILLASAALGVYAGTSATIRGLSPSEQLAVQDAGGLPCSVQGEASFVPLDRVNDDYCDCDDGQDEPGTAACSHLVRNAFYCHNDGFFPTKIPTALLNDGVCDCCDGSDEYDASVGATTCTNTCAEDAAKQREKAAKKLMIVETGFYKRERALFDAVKVRMRSAEYQLKEKEEVLASLRTLQKRVAVLKAREERREKQMQLERARQSQEEDKEEQEQDDVLHSALASNTDGSSEGGGEVGQCAAGEVCDAETADAGQADAEVTPIDATDVSVDDVTTIPDEDANIVVDTTCEDKTLRTDQIKTRIELSDGTKVSLEDYFQMQSAKSTQKKTQAPDVEKADKSLIDQVLRGDEEQKKRIGLRVLRTIGLLCSPVRFTVEAVLFVPRLFRDFVTSFQSLQPVVDRIPTWSKVVHSTAFRGLAGGTPYRAYKYVAWCGQVVWDAPLWAYEYLFPAVDHDLTLPEAESLREVHREIEDSIQDLQKERDALHADETFDFGPDRAYYALKGECIEKTVGKYVYKFCPFDKVDQDHTSLGSWEAWGRINDTTVDYTSMRYTKGQSCWNGPERSITIKLECGDANDIVSVQEPSTCVYEMIVRTHLACSSDVLAKAREEVAFWSK